MPLTGDGAPCNPDRPTTLRVLAVGDSAMAITSFTRFAGGNRDGFIAAARRAKALFEQAGGEFEVGQIYSGPDIGQWVAMIRFPDWAAYGSAMTALSGDAAYLRMMAELGAANPPTDRMFMVGLDL